MDVSAIAVSRDDYSLINSVSAGATLGATKKQPDYLLHLLQLDKLDFR